MWFAGRWDGTIWRDLDFGTDDDIWTLTPWVRGGSPALFVGGMFTEAGGEPADYLATWGGCSSEPNPCPADVSGDGMISLPDLNLVLSNFGLTTGAGDTNDDGLVNLIDLNAVLSQFGQDCP